MRVALLGPVAGRTPPLAYGPWEQVTGPLADGRIAEALHVSHALARSGEFDLVHHHLDRLPLAFAGHCRAPLVATVHGCSDAADRSRDPDDMATVDRMASDCPAVYERIIGGRGN